MPYKIRAIVILCVLYNTLNKNLPVPSLVLTCRVNQKNMRSTVDHLPENMQAEPARIVEFLLEEMSSIHSNHSFKHSKLNWIDQIIPFGSCTGKCWMDDKAARRGVGHQSDNEILAAMNCVWVAKPDVWHPAEDRFLFAPESDSPVGLIGGALVGWNHILLTCECRWPER